MGWKQWAVVALVIGGGVVMQIPGHTGDAMDHGAIASETRPGEESGLFTTVHLDVTGMT
jgi:hypothetical protein